ncbi:MAG: DNA mismatch repair endonuclease MutL [Nitrospiraceae bacterium]|nr:DNA mismatch repair endonuclease MutL [Nitrospiraceae bacterium]
MPSINILPDTLINKIAAGEVVERPASVVKELIENSLDADATEVIVDVEQAGKRLIRISDNGSGMSPEDAVLSFQRHATSKIASEKDLESIMTMGFRGEALASIASVSRVRLLTCLRGDSAGTVIEIDGGVLKPAQEAASPAGTTIEVHHLFHNTPARLKFLKSPATELSHIVAAVSHQAMSHPAVRFRLTQDKKTVLDLPASQNIIDRAFQIFGSDLAENLMEFSGQREPARVHGLIGNPNVDRGDRSFQEFYVNGRYVRNASLSHALYEAYRDLIMRDRHPVGFIFIDIDPGLVDVNVHPAKAEVRFRNQSQVHDLVRDVIRESLRGAHGQAPESLFGRVQEAVAGYLGSAEGGAGSATSFEFGVRSSEPVAERSDAGAYHAVPHSQLRTPVSELLQPLAQVHDSFIIAQDNDGMALIDQHAAHERVLFEKLQDQYAHGSIPQQNLLLPVQMELGHAESALLAGLLGELRNMGFQIEEFGGGTFMIKAVPALLAGGDHKQLILDILGEIRTHGATSRFDKLRDEILSVMACHPAIKVHRKLSMPEMEGLIRDLFACRMPHSCPHGRPTIVRFSLDEIRRMFKRI